MRPVPVRSAWLQLIAVFGGFLFGPLAALLLSRMLAPGSALVQTAGVFGFAMVFVGGTLVWMGFGFVALVVDSFRRLAAGVRRSHERSRRVAPPGYRAYVVLGAVIGVGVGLLTGLATEAPPGVSVAVWAATGLAYGLLLSAAAHHGYLPFLEPE